MDCSFLCGFCFDDCVVVIFGMLWLLEFEIGFDVVLIGLELIFWRFLNIFEKFDDKFVYRFIILLMLLLSCWMSIIFWVRFLGILVLWFWFILLMSKWLWLRRNCICFDILLKMEDICLFIGGVLFFFFLFMEFLF